MTALFLVPPIQGAAGAQRKQELKIRGSGSGLGSGSADGTFKPDQPITRAEAVTIINAMLNRKADADNMLEDMICWPDNADVNAWYYEAIQEATNGHAWKRIDGENVWTQLLPALDWSRLENPSNRYYFPVIG